MAGSGVGASAGPRGTPTLSGALGSGCALNPVPQRAIVGNRETLVLCVRE